MKRPETHRRGNFKALCRTVGSLIDIYPARRKSCSTEKLSKTGGFSADTSSMKRDWMSVGGYIKKSSSGYRCSETSRFVKESYAKSHPKTTQKDRLPNSGTGISSDHH